MSVQIIRGDARTLPLTDDSVDLIVTSPPYFGLRSYTDDGEHYAGQVGDEATPAEFVAALIECTREMMRVTKPSGSIWVNLGDKYVADNRGSGSDWKRGKAKHAPRGPSGYPGAGIMPHKSLMGIPWRYAIRCIDDLGLILREEVIWSKPNAMPESVTDRCKRAHEQWFHFTLNPRYYSAVDEVRVEHASAATTLGRRHGGAAFGEHKNTGGDGSRHTDGHPLGKLPPSVWSVPTEPLTVPESLGVDHYAAFPTEFPRRIITGWSPEHVCTGCGEGRFPVQATSTTIGGYACACTPRTSNRGKRGDWREGRAESPEHLNEFGSGSGNAVPRRTGGFGTKVPPPDATEVEYHFGEWQPPPTTAGVVLDPFGGTGTTALCADVLGRSGISNDMSADYNRIARWRTTDPAQRAKAARRPFKASPKPAVGQDSLLDLLGEESA